MVWQVSLAQFYMPIEKTSNSFVTADGYCTPLIEKGSIHFRGDLGYVINGKTFWDKGISSTIPNVNASLTVFNSYAPKTLKFAKDITVHEGEALPAELLMPGYLFEDVTSGGDAVSSDVTTEMIDPRIIWEVTQGKDKVQRAIAADADDPANIGWGWGKGLHKGSAVLKATSIKTMEQNEEDDMNPVLSTAMNITITWAKDAVYIKDAEIETPDVTLGLEGTASQLLKVILEKSDPKKSITTEYSISWSSDNEKVAKVTEKKSNKHFAMVEAVAEGTAKITATITEGSEIQEKTIHTAVCTVTVTKDGGASVTPETTPSGIDTTPVIPTIDMDPDMFSPAAPVTLTDPTELPGFAEKDVTIDNKGNITPKKSVVTKTVNSVVEKAVAAGTVEKGTKVEEQKMLPAFKAAGAPGRIISVGFDIKGSDLFADAPKNVKLVKVNSAAGKSDFFKYAANKDEYADMTYSVVASDNSVPEKLDANETYTLILFIQDGGDFDLDGQIDGSVTDPTAIVKTKVETESSTPDTPSGGDAGSGSSGGCNAGFAGMLLLGLIPAFIFKKKD